MSKLQVTAEYTGRERQDQERWQVMREAADRYFLHDISSTCVSIDMLHF